MAFKTLITILSLKPVLQMYNPSPVITEVHTDISSYGLAGILLQEESPDSLHLVYCISKSTTDAKNRYRTSKLEVYAIIWILSR